MKPASPDLPKPPPARGYKGLIGGSFGELDHQVLLQQFAGKPAAEEIAPHWRGGQYEIIENRKKNRAILLYASQWDDAESARKFFEAYRKALAGKWKKMEVRSETAGHAEGPRRRRRFRPAAGGQRRHQHGRAGAASDGPDGGSASAGFIRRAHGYSLRRPATHAEAGLPRILGAAGPRGREHQRRQAGVRDPVGRPGGWRSSTTCRASCPCIEI